MSSSSSDFKTVIATCDGSATSNVIVYELTGYHIAADWFTGRSTTKYGVAEVANLSFMVSPTGVTAPQMGGLLWQIVAGNGTLVNVGTSGLGTYTCHWTTESVTLKLVVQSGPSKDRSVEMAFTVTPPTGFAFEQTPGSGIRHNKGHASCGFRADIYLRPKDVSFKNIGYGEGSVQSVRTGWYLAKFPDPAGYVHPENEFDSVGGGDSAKGCKVSPSDGIWSGWMDPPPPHAYGTFKWPIPERYNVGGGGWTTINGTADQEETIYEDGKLCIKKAGVGPPFCKNLNDDDSSW